MCTCNGGRFGNIQTFFMIYRQKGKELQLFLEDRIWNERVRGCGGNNVKEIEENMRRRKDGEETNRLAYFNSSNCT